MADATALYESVIKRLEGGGIALQADLADIEAGKESAVSTGQANLIQGGLGGTTVMGAVPLAAEKTAVRSRMRARGSAEEKYMQAVISFAHLAESSKQQELNRQAGRQSDLLNAQTRLQMGGLPTGGTMSSPVRTYGGTYGASSFPDMFSIPGERPMGSSGGSSSQYPSLYNTGGTTVGGGSMPSVPDWMGSGGGDGWNAPREYDPSMVGKSLWAQGGSGTTLEQNTKQAVTSALPQSAKVAPEPFKSTTNYMGMLYNKTGEQVSSQQEAYARLYA
jgi:hypothetical protein